LIADRSKRHPTTRREAIFIILFVIFRAHEKRGEENVKLQQHSLLFFRFVIIRSAPVDMRDLERRAQSSRSPYLWAKFFIREKETQINQPRGVESAI
jgi:hypothetical protein